MIDQLLNPTAWKWGGIATATAVVVAVALVLVWFAGSRYGKHRTATAKDANARATAKDRLLFAAALAAGATVYAGFVIGSYQGLTGFARDYLGWAGWLRNIVPVTLDGGAAAFAFLAFRAVARRKSPLRCYAIVWTAAGASASFNYIEGGADHTTWGGAYLAFLSLAGMSMFHTFLDQFRGAADLATYPKFGLRWITYLPNTACAALAWINHPLPDGAEPTVALAVEHLAEVRAGKRAQADTRRVERAATGGWTLRPWARSAALSGALAKARAEAADTAEALRSLSEQFAQFRSERDAERVAEQARLAEAEQEAERLRTELAERSEQAAMARAERALEHRPERPTERPTDGGRQQRSTAGRSGRSTPSDRPAGAPKMSDAEAVEAMLAEHPEHDYEWPKREVHRITGAGFGRIDKLIVMVAEHHAARASERTHRAGRSTGSDDSEERAG